MRGRGRPPYDAAVAPGITSFQLQVPDAELDDLRDRLRRTRWPERETVDDWSQGIPLAYVQDLCAYWENDYDWRRVEAELNHFEQLRSRPRSAPPTSSASRCCTPRRRTPTPCRSSSPTAGPGRWSSSSTWSSPCVTRRVTAATRPMRSTSSARRCPATGSATSPPAPAGASDASPTPGPN